MYYYYELKIDKKDGQVHLTAPAYPELGILSTGKTVNDAFSQFYEPLFNHWNDLIKNQKRFPKFLDLEDSKSFVYDNNMYIGLNPREGLKIMLHHAMLDKGVTRAQLANLIALTPKEWDEQADRTDLKKALLIKPDAPPQYQRVKRVLDLKHPSKMHEIEDAIRCLDLQIHLKVVDRNPRKEKLYTTQI